MRVTGGQWAGRPIAVPPGLGVRPTPAKVRQAIFNSLGPWIEDCTVLELFAGSGALSLECLSRGAVSALCVEKSAKHARCLKGNAGSLGAMVDVRVADAMRVIRQLTEAGQQFDLIAADPPYGNKTAPGRRSESWAQKLLDEEDLPALLAEDGVFLLGHTKRDAVEIAAPWRTHKTLKHGDTWIRLLGL